MRHLMWILTAIAVGIGGVLGAASVIMLSASHPSGGPAPTATVRPADPPSLVTKQKTGEPARSLILASQRHTRLSAEPRTADSTPTD